MPKPRKPGRGGKRPGAGRKRSDPSGKKTPHTVWLAPAEREYLERLAGGSAAAGIRRLIAAGMSG